MPKQIDLSAFESLKEMTGPDFIGELIDTFLEDAPKLIMELHAALEANDSDSFRRASHSLKSNAASFGATHLSLLAKDLEMLAKENRLADVGQQVAAVEEAYKLAAEELKGMRT